jgi:hypothetical protein
MSFLTETFEVPLWFLVFAFACAAPLWISWYKAIFRKITKLDFVRDKFSDSDVIDQEVSILKKATDNWNASVEHELKSAELKKTKRDHDINSTVQPYVKIVLKTLALNGDAGMLLQSIADKLEVSSNEIKSSLSYLEKNEFIESVSGNSGTKYYLVSRGKKYCIKRGYITE